MSATVHDRSMRFVLQEDAPYLSNLAALWAADPIIATEIEGALSEEFKGCVVEPSKSGPPTVAIVTGESRLYLHSRHNPVDEAEKLVAPIDVTDNLVYYVHGLGFGYHLQALCDRTSDDAVICIFEDNLELIRAALWHRDLSEIIEKRRLLLFTRPDKGDLFTRLNPYTALINAGIVTIDHAPSLRASPDFHQQMKTWLEEFASLSRTSVNTLLMNGRKTAENISKNLGWYTAASGIDGLKDTYKGQPAIIVSAGPSLRKNKHLLPEASKSAVIIATQTTLQPLVEMGVEPHFVTSLDYHDICTRFFEKLPPTIRTQLVAEPKATNTIFGMHPGPVALLGNEFAEAMLRETQTNKAMLPAGATVAHLSFYLAEYLGCDPIIFVGQDLGFSDNLSYVPGTGHDDVARPEMGRFYTPEMRQWETIARDRRILRKVPDIHGRPIYTEERLYAYLQQFERDFSKSPARIIDATEGGALKRGATVMALADVLKQFCTQPVRPPGDEKRPPAWDRLPEVIRSLKKRCDEARRIERISDDTLPLLRGVRDAIEDQHEVNRLIAKIDKLRNQMNELGSSYDLITQMTQTTEIERFKADMRISASKLTGVARQKQQVERDIANVTAVRDAAKEFQRMVEALVASFEHDMQRLCPQQQGRAA